jgi:hypothetical protein
MTFCTQSRYLNVRVGWILIHTGHYQSSFLENVTTQSIKFLKKAIIQNIFIFSFLTLIFSKEYITYKCIKILPKNFAQFTHTKQFETSTDITHDIFKIIFIHVAQRAVWNPKILKLLWEFPAFSSSCILEIPYWDSSVVTVVGMLLWDLCERLGCRYPQSLRETVLRHYY